MNIRPMNIRNLAAAVVATLGMAGALPATAADLDSGYRPGPPYDDPRYSDIYRHPAPPPPRQQHYAAPYQPYPSYRDDRYAAPPPYVPPQPQYQRGDRQGAGCLPQQVIRDKLARHGWHDFHDPQVAGHVAHVRARRPNGRLFDITVDRCTGEILQAEQIDSRSAEAPDWRYRDDRYRY